MLAKVGTQIGKGAGRRGLVGPIALLQRGRITLPRGDAAIILVLRVAMPSAT